MDEKMLKSKFCGSIQEVILPDFLDDDDTVTTTGTRSRRVSFGTNFVKEFMVGSAVSAQCVSEYEQAFSSSDSSNANSSQSVVENEPLSQNTYVLSDNLKANLEAEESHIKRPKVSSTICFSADSPTADMEFTEGCISLAKSIFEKKNKEMTVIIQAKPKEPKEGIKISKDEETKYFDGSQFDMSLTKCLKSKENKKEEKRFESEKTRIFTKYDDEMSFTRCDKVFRMRQTNTPSEDDNDSSDEEDNCKENIMPLDMIMRHLDKDNSDLEKSLFNPEKLLSDVLNKTSWETSSDSEKLNLNESMDITKDIHSDLFKIPHSVACHIKLAEEITVDKVIDEDMSIDSKNDCDSSVDKKNEEVASCSNYEKNMTLESRTIEIENSKNEEVTSKHLEDMEIDTGINEIISKDEEAILSSKCEENMTTETKNNEVVAKDQKRASNSKCEEDMTIEMSHNKVTSKNEEAVSNSKYEEDVITERRNNEIVFKGDEIVSSSKLEEALTTDTKTNEILSDNEEAVSNFEKDVVTESRNHEVAPNNGIEEDMTIDARKLNEILTKDGEAASSSKCEENMTIETSRSEVLLKNGEAASKQHEEDMEIDTGINEIISKKEEAASGSNCEEDMTTETKNNEVVSFDSQPAMASNDESEFVNNKKSETTFDSKIEDVSPSKICNEEDVADVNNDMEEDKVVLNNSTDEFDGQIFDEEASLSKIDISLSDLEQEDEEMNASVTIESPVAAKEDTPSKDTTTTEAKQVLQPSLVDSKVLENLKDQASEPGCVWTLKDFKVPGNKNRGLLSFDFRVLESTATVEFLLKNSEDESLQSCSGVLKSEVRLNEEDQFKLPEYYLVTEFGFEKLKKIFNKERKNVKTIRHVPYFLDQMNLFAVKINSCLRQMYRILTLYPGSKLKDQTLSFRLFSFPIFFSCTVCVDLSDVHRLTTSCLSFEFDFGCFNKDKITEIFQECLKCENPLCEFIVQSTKHIIELERETGYVSKRQHIRLLPRDFDL